MNRLSTVDLDAHGGIGTYNTYEQYTYDSLGNIKTKTYTPYQKSTKTLTYSYDNYRPHAVSDVGSKHYTYDANGNVSIEQAQH